MSALYSVEELQGVPVLVLGASRSGLAAARLLSEMGAEVFVSELRPAEELGGAVAELERLGVVWETGGHRLEGFPLPEFGVVSPGIHTDAPIIQGLRREGRPVFSEVEVASWYYYGTLVAVTGSNGKSTTVSWIEHVLRSVGLEAIATGNIGYPFCDMVREHPTASHAVVEVSSYQLETITSFRPHVSVVTNISPDHLDRHGSLMAYAEAKGRIWLNQSETDWTVIPEGDGLIASISTSIRPQKVKVRLDGVPAPGAGVEGEALWVNLTGRPEKLLGLAELPVPGRHNVSNALATAAVCRVLQLSPGEIGEGLRSFGGVPHRLEVVGQNGRNWINDSKATNVESLRVALESVPAPIWLIAGGRDKGASYAPLRELVEQRVEKLLLIGEGAERLERELGDLAEVVPCGTLPRAVELAAREAGIGTNVLLSPGCASFDQYASFEERGDQFRDLVAEVVRR